MRYLIITASALLALCISTFADVEIFGSEAAARDSSRNSGRTVRYRKVSSRTVRHRKVRSRRTTSRRSVRQRRSWGHNPRARRHYSRRPRYVPQRRHHVTKHRNCGKPRCVKQAPNRATGYKFKGTKVRFKDPVTVEFCHPFWNRLNYNQSQRRWYKISLRRGSWTAPAREVKTRCSKQTVERGTMIAIKPNCFNDGRVYHTSRIMRSGQVKFSHKVSGRRHARR